VNVTTAALPAPPPERIGILGWLTTTNHKHIGILYIVTTLGFFALSGLMAMLIRADLTVPEHPLVGRQFYAEMFTLHGTGMIFLVIAPFGLGIANYILPLQVGAPDMAYPRLNALSYWLFLLGGLVIMSAIDAHAIHAALQ
jgi:cytochrome c oxidase subunit 1